MIGPITPCIWCEDAKKVIATYEDAFENFKITTQSGVVTKCLIGNSPLMLLSAGPMFRPTPSISFYTTIENRDTLTHAHKILLGDEGMEMMPLGKYDWSDHYAFIEDKHGVSWQLTLGDPSLVNHQVAPALMFTGVVAGRSSEAVNLYTSIFDNSEIIFSHPYPSTDPVNAGTTAHCQFNLANQRFVAMDSGNNHKISFTEGLSLSVACDTQEEIDHLWALLCNDGTEGQCGWLKDKFGVSWQIVPTILEELMQDPVRAKRVTAAFMKMKKLDISTLVSS